MGTIRVKRAYDPITAEDGHLFLVDRLWPRGIKKESLSSAAWIKEAAPSNALRKWFGHDPLRWEEFRERYAQELLQHRETLEPIRHALKKGPVTLLYSAKDSEHNNAVVLAEFLRHPPRSEG